MKPIGTRASRSRRSCRARLHRYQDVKGFPTDHPLHAEPLATFPGGKLLKEADVILSLDAVDLAGTLSDEERTPVGAKVIRRSMRTSIADGAWTTKACRRRMWYLMCEPDVAVRLLIDAVKARPAAVSRYEKPTRKRRGNLDSSARARVQRAHRRHGRMPFRLPLGWSGAYRHFPPPDGLPRRGRRRRSSSADPDSPSALRSR